MVVVRVMVATLVARIVVLVGDGDGGCRSDAGGYNGGGDLPDTE